MTKSEQKCVAKVKAELLEMKPFTITENLKLLCAGMLFGASDEPITVDRAKELATDILSELGTEPEVSMEFFDWLALFGAYIEINGSFNPDNTFINVSAVMPKDPNNKWDTVYLNCNGAIRVFGRSETPDLDEAIENLANQISNQNVSWGDEITLHVPNLIHTTDYRGKKYEKKTKGHAKSKCRQC